MEHTVDLASVKIPKKKLDNAQVLYTTEVKEPITKMELAELMVDFFINNFPTMEKYI